MRSILAQREVSATLIIVLLIAKQQIAKMPFAKNDYMIEALSSDRAY